MRVLSHGIPFFCDEQPLRLYEGAHEIRYLGNYERADFRYDPKAEDATGVIERIAREWSPDLLLCWMPEVHPPPVRIEEAPVKTVALVSDWNVFYRVLKTNLARYDVVLCDKAGAGVLRSDLVNAHHLFPLYSQISTIHKTYPGPKSIDVAFAGNLNHAAHRQRARYLERLAALAGRYRVVVTTDLEPADYGRLLSASRVVFNHSIRGELNLRVFETIACGAVPMLEEANLEVRDWFEDGRDIVLYNEDNFEERLEHLLKNPEEAGAIAARAHARAEEFAGENRFTDLIEWAAGQPGGGRPFRELDAGERVYQDFLMYAFSRFPVYHPMEEDLLARLTAAAPEDPGTWWAVGQHMANPYSRAGSGEERNQRALKAFVRAQQLAPESGPHALNAASFARAIGNPGVEAHFLQATLDAVSLEGAELVIGSQASEFWWRWYRAVAEQRAAMNMLRAEAHYRVATLLARNGRLTEAEDHLNAGREADPVSTTGVALRAEIEWATGRRGEACQTLEDRVHDMPLDPGVRNRLADMLTECGETRRAKELRAEIERMTGVLPAMELH